WHHRRHHQPGRGTRGAERRARADRGARGASDRRWTGTHPHRHLHSRQRSVANTDGRGGAPRTMYLGLDIGTSSVKGVLMDGAERVVASRTAPLEVSRPHAGWSEQDPESWWTACEKVLDGLAREHPKELGAVRGIGLSGHMHGATLLDAADKPLRPCILWNDVRSADEAAELDRDPKFRKITGNIVFPGFTAPKLVWVERHEKATFARVAKVLLP